MLSVLLAVALAVGVFEYQNYIPIGYTEEALIGLDYEDAVEKLESQGFSQIDLEEKSDLPLLNKNEENKVTDVIIEDIDSFDAKTKCRYNTEITIVYHTLKMANAPFISKDSKGLNFLDVHDKFSNEGFINIRYEVIYDIITGWIISDGDVESVTINGKEDFDSYDDFRPDAEVVITYHTMKKNKPKQ